MVAAFSIRQHASGTYNDENFTQRREARQEKRNPSVFICVHLWQKFPSLLMPLRHITCSENKHKSVKLLGELRTFA